MKKTLTINLSGIVFNIDEDAYKKLNDYLQELNDYFSDSAEGKEIISDIETRIAELFQEKINENKQVISLKDVIEITEIMGNLEDFSDEEKFGEEKKQPTDKKYKIGKRIYRDPDNSIIGGVCAGLGAYFGIDPVILRIIFIITIFASSPLIYIILWIVIPEAKTTSQKLEMRGEKVNVSNIEKSIKEEFENVKENFKNIQNNKGFKQTKNFFSKLINLIVVVITGIIKFVISVTGIVFIVIALIILTSLAGAFLFDFNIISFNQWGISSFSLPSLPSFFNLFAESSDVTLTFITLFIVIIIPFLALLYLGLKMLFKIKTGSKVIGITAFVFWFIALILLSFMVSNQAIKYKVEKRITQSKELKSFNSDTLYIDFSKPVIDKQNSLHLCFDSDENIYVYDNELFIQPELNIVKNDTNIVELSITKESRGFSQDDAIKNIENIIYNWSQNDSLLVLEQYFTTKKEQKWRNQKLFITIKIPDNKNYVLY